jgi:hypothetical protein
VKPRVWRKLSRPSTISLFVEADLAEVALPLDMTWLRFKRVRADGTFKGGVRTKLLVDFFDDNTNEDVGDWCPKWDDLEEIVLNAVDVETENDGAYVAMLEKIEQRLAKRMPKLSVARHKAIIRAYTPPMIEVENLGTDNPGFGKRETYRLTAPIPQSVLDAFVSHEMRVSIVVQEDKVTNIYVKLWPDPEANNSMNEVSAMDVSMKTFEPKRSLYQQETRFVPR